MIGDICCRSVFYNSDDFGNETLVASAYIFELDDAGKIKIVKKIAADAISIDELMGRNLKGGLRYGRKKRRTYN